jgi:uncharacterized protein YqiB (DUF1249 family)
MAIDYALVKVDRIHRQILDNRNGLNNLTDIEKKYLLLCEGCNNLIIMEGLISERKITNKLVNLYQLTNTQAHRLLTDTKEIYGTRTTKQKDYERNRQIERLKDYVEDLVSIAKINKVSNPKASTAAYDSATRAEAIIANLMAYDKEDDVRITPDMLTPPNILFTPNPAVLGRPLPEMRETLEAVRQFISDKKINVELIDPIEYDESTD